MSAPHPQTSLSHPAPAVAPEPIIRVRDLVVGFGSKIVMKGLNLDIRRGEILGFVGPSGQGKSVLTRAILGLVPKRSGTTIMGSFEKHMPSASGVLSPRTR